MRQRKGLLTVFAGLACVILMTTVAWAVEVAPGVQVHGFMQNRLEFGDGSNLEFRSERISIQAIAALAEESTAMVELYYHPWTPSNGLYVESAYYDTGLAGGRVRVGKGRRLAYSIVPSYPNRKTSNYGLFAEALTQDRIQGVQWVYSQRAMDFGVAVHTGYRLGYRLVGEIPGDDVRNLPNAATGKQGHTIPHLALRDPVSGGGNPAGSPSGNLSRKLQWSSRLGTKLGNGLKGGISYSYGSLDERDLTNLRTSAPTNILTPANPITGAAATTDEATSPIPPLGLDFTSDSMDQLGFDLAWKHPKGFLVQGEWSTVDVSDLEYDVWQVTVGFEPPQGWKFFARYAEQDMNTPLTHNPLTWDQQQLSLSLVQPLRKGLWLQYEYERNTEDVDIDTGRDVDNNLFFIELFSGF